MKVEIEIGEIVSAVKSDASTIEGRLSNAINQQASEVEKWERVAEEAKDKLRLAKSELSRLRRIETGETS